MRSWRVRYLITPSTGTRVDAHGTCAFSESAGNRATANIIQNKQYDYAYVFGTRFYATKTTGFVRRRRRRRLSPVTFVTYTRSNIR